MVKRLDNFLTFINPMPWTNGWLGIFGIVISLNLIVHRSVKYMKDERK